MISNPPIDSLSSVEDIVRETIAGVPAEDVAHLTLLARDSLAVVAQPDLDELDIEAFRAACRVLLDLGRQRNPGQPVIRVEKTSLAEPTHSHTVLAVVTDDMPFLVDSLSSELQRRDLTIHHALHPQLDVLRDGEGKLVEIHAEPSGDGDGRPESFMYFEIDAVGDQAALVELETAILKILADVRSAVEDWRAIRKTARRVAAELETGGASWPDDDVREAVAFLHWVEADHFTFLAFLEHRLEEEEGERFLRRVRGTGLGLWRKTPLAIRADDRKPVTGYATSFLGSDQLVWIAKSTRRSTVHRDVHMDVLSVKKLVDGEVVGEYRFLGLFTSVAYAMRASRIPLVRRKVARVIERAPFRPASHNAKGFRHIVETYPRDELFQISENDLYHFALRILDLRLRPRVSLLVRRDEGERFVSCMLFVPRDHHSTRLRHRLERLLEGIFHGDVTANYTYISDEPLARVLFILRTRPGEIPDVDMAKIEQRLTDASRPWSDRLKDVFTGAWGEEEGLAVWRRYSDAFPMVYAELSAPGSAIHDVPKIERVIERSTFALRLYRLEDAAISRFHLRTFELAAPAPLSDLLPQIENMGLEVITEVPFEVRPLHSSNPVWIRDFELATSGHEVDLEAVRDPLEEAIRRVWRGEMDNDPFNQLVIRAGLDWREVVVLRAYSRYLRQIGSAFSQRYLADILAAHSRPTRLLSDLFAALFDPHPAAKGSAKRRADTLRRQLAEALDEIRNADADRILRRFLNLIESTLRTNHYQRLGGAPKPYLSLKFDAHQIEGLPQPRPRYEIFVFSPEMEAVHLRGGRVARGGIRWSDRLEDFRTEILGLVKSQMVKNAVIVPVGAKGGFVVKHPPHDREDVQAHGLHCYTTLIRGLLDVTDNLDPEGKTVPPPDVVRRDGDDPYLVVAADKGTATFSDTANRVAAEYGFWLGDAFASGGSVGYDHKKMGITARGAWESVKRHFREMGRNIQKEPFTVVGVGDMSGDVFGNGMLLSEHIRLQAAFNHLHIFIDPDPDPASSFVERQRLFAERRGWDGYDRQLLSPGGEVYDRHAIRLTVSDAVRDLLQLASSTLEPAALIRAVLRLDADLLWFGGIGTYVKASDESHAEVGDRANDGVRIDADHLRAKVVGEGANLGVTQAGRIEYALRGGRLNTDFIDNSGGVDCSDHEVNMKIVLGDAIRSGRLTAAERDELLPAMTGEVTRLVKRSNYLQSQSISLTEAQGAAILSEQAQLIVDLERAGQLDRELEGLPAVDELAERHKSGRGLTRPEISVLLAASKIYVYNELIDSALPDDPRLEDDLVLYFPRQMRERFQPEIARHRLRREIIATHVTNSILNRMGPTFMPRMARETGRTVSEIARAYTAARDLFDLRALWRALRALDNFVPAKHLTEMYLHSIQMLERSTRWLLRYGGRPLDVTGLLERHHEDIILVGAQVIEMLSPRARDKVRRRTKRFRELGVVEGIDSWVASLEYLPAAFDVARCSSEAGIGVERVGRIYFAVGEVFGINRLLRGARSLVDDHPFRKAAVEALAEDLYSHQADLTRQVAKTAPARSKAAIDDWRGQHCEAWERYRLLLEDIDGAGKVDLAMLTVAERELRRLSEG